MRARGDGKRFRWGQVLRDGSRRRQKPANLSHRETDLHVEGALPQLCRRAARVTQDSVLWTVRPKLRLAIPGGVTDDGLSHCRGDQISAHPCVVLVEIHHFRGVEDVTMEAEWIAVLRQVVIERIVGWSIDLVAVENASSSAEPAVELLGDLLVDLR